MCGHPWLDCLYRILCEAIYGFLLWRNAAVFIPDHIRYLSAIFAIEHNPFSVEEVVRLESQWDEDLGVNVP